MARRKRSGTIIDFDDIFKLSGIHVYDYERKYGNGDCTLYLYAEPKTEGERGAHIVTVRQFIRMVFRSVN